MGLNGKLVRFDENQNNPGAAPATVSELRWVKQSLRFETFQYVSMWEGNLSVDIPLASPETGLKLGS